MTTADNISEYADVIDVRDIISRVEELEGESDDHEGEREGPEGNASGMLPWVDSCPDDAEELAQLTALLDDLKGNGGDEQWRGDWYPVTLVRDSYFESYAQEMAEDIGAIKDDATWPNNCIDWERAARELQQDYGSVEYRDVTYWYR